MTATDAPAATATPATKTIDGVSVAFVDLETGGLRVKDRPWEVAILLVDPDGTQIPYLLHISDFKPSESDPKALELAGFYDRHPGFAKERINTDGPDPDNAVHYAYQPEAVVAIYVERLLRGRVIVACNPGFDTERHLAQMLDRAGLAPTWAYRPICATSYAAGRLGLPAYLWNNAAIGEALGVKRDAHGAPHTGLVDAYYARDLFNAAHADAAA